MSHDLERAFGDLADAAARAAGRGLLAAPSMEPTLHRIVGTVRRRRAARAVGASGLALALVVGTAGAVNAGWFGNGPAVVPATPSPIATPVSTGLCGATTAQLEALTSALPSLVVTSMTADAVSAGDPFRFMADASVPLAATSDSSVALVRDGRVVGAGVVAEPAEMGMTSSWSGPAVVDGCATLDGVTRAGAGDYEMWLVSTVTLTGGEPTLVARGPWSITLSDGLPPEPGPTESPAPPATVFACGASDEALYALDDPFTAPQPIGITAPPVDPVALDGVPGLTISVDNLDAEPVDLAGAQPAVVLTRGHVIVGGAELGISSMGPARVGESTEFVLTSPLHSCPAGGDALDTGGPALTAGQYGAFVVLTVQRLGTTSQTLAVGGPFALTLTAP